MSNQSDDILIVGAGIAGLTLGLCLHEKGIPCQILERATEIRPLGVGINVLPHATRVLRDLGLGPALDAVAIRTQEAGFFNRFGQLIFTDPLGTAAGYATPQYSVHRGDLQQVLVDAFVARARPRREESRRDVRAMRSRVRRRPPPPRRRRPTVPLRPALLRRARSATPPPRRRRRRFVFP